MNARPRLVLFALPLAACLAALPTTTLAATLKVEESAIVDAPPAAVWKLVGDFAGLPAWHPAVAATTITQGKNNVPGAVRDIATKDGATIIEKLVAYQPAHRAMTYRIVESPLPVSGYRSTLAVLPAGQGSKIVWKSSFRRNPAAAGVDDAKAREIVTGIYRAGFEGLRAALSQPR